MENISLEIEKIISILDICEENDDLQEEYEKYFVILKKYLKIYYEYLVKDI